MFAPLAWGVVGFPLALIIYLFSLWRKLKGEYPQNSIICYSLFTILAFILAGISAYALFDGDYFLLAGVIGLAITSILFSYSNKWNNWYLLESTTPAVLLSVITFLLGMAFTFAKMIYFIHALFLFITYLLKNLWNGYRSFAWYHSGKPGFLFLAPLAVILFLESGLAFYLTNGLYWRSLLLGLSSLGVGAIIFIRSKK